MELDFQMRNWTQKNMSFIKVAIAEYGCDFSVICKDKKSFSSVNRSLERNLLYKKRCVVAIG